MKGQKTGGRSKGTPNRVSVDGRQEALRYARKALRTLVSIMENPEASDAARVKAADSIMTRAWGRPVQPIELSPSVVPPRFESFDELQAYFGMTDAEMADIRGKIRDDV